jgi:hypothetical protein
MKPKGIKPRISPPGCRLRMVTLRMPAELHTRLLIARHKRSKAMNAICCELLDLALEAAEAADTAAIIENAADSTPLQNTEAPL